MNKIVHYVGLDVHKETIAIAVVEEPIYSLRSPGGAGNCGVIYLSETQGGSFLATPG